MSGGSSVLRRPTAQKSNAEFILSLRANFTAAQEAVPHKTNGHSSTQPPASNVDSQSALIASWTRREDASIFVPAINIAQSGLAEERSRYEITMKLFFLPNKPKSCRCAQTREAVNLVLQELKVPSIDLLIVSFPGIAFDADDSDGEGEEHGAEFSPPEPRLGDDAVAEDVDTMIATWECLEELHDEGVIATLGVSEFGVDRLSRFLKRARVRPSVDQINVRDCCVVPRPLIAYARQERIELLTHNDCTNILSRATLRELLAENGLGAALLGENSEAEPQWVIKYTAVVRDRGVVENKGYFALAEGR